MHRNNVDENGAGPSGTGYNDDNVGNDSDTGNLDNDINNGDDLGKEDDEDDYYMGDSEDGDDQ